MRPRYDYAAIVALSSAAAVMTALSEYALSLEKSVNAANLRMAVAFFITALALMVARRLGSALAPQKSEGSPQPDRERLLISSPNHRCHAPVDPLVMKRLGKEISACNPIVFTLCDHVQDVVANTEDVAMTIMAQLNKVDRTITQLVRYLRDSSHDQILPIIEQTEQQIRENSEILTRFLASRMAAMDMSNCHLSSIADLAQRLDTIVQSIRKVSRQTNMLALNATIEAARAGEPGRGFAVVAFEVKALARQTDQAAKDISEGLQTLKSAIAESVETLVVRQARDERNDLCDIAAANYELGQNMGTLIGQHRETLEKMRQESESIAQLVIDLIGSIQFQDVARQRLNGVTGVLHQIVDHADSLATFVGSEHFDEENVEGALASLQLQRMQASEHSKISHVTGAGSSVIELF
jgi:methyl-accepting chemotaxis protein